MAARFHIGIDLGTTNCSLAYYHCDEGIEAEPRLLPIKQWENEAETRDDHRLPSFLWMLPKNRLKKPFAASFHAVPQNYLVGRYAREYSLSEPLEVVHSAKSWASVGRVELRSGKILPWGSAGEKISPLEAQTAFLKHLVDAWNLIHPGDPLASQRVVITIPASFDELAQRLTIEAAKAAGLAKVELIEEPIAAFYDWQAQAHKTNLSENSRILVCDVGGGTADFSLLLLGKDRSERLKVSDHLLLGGDNIDLALTHKIASRLSSEELPRAAYNLLFVQVRQLKESALNSSKEETYHLSIPLDSKNLFGKFLSGSIEAREIRAWILDDFFPMVNAETKTSRNTGLQTWGLPYAKDSRITAHLAEFTAGEKVDALLCVGGTLIPEVLKKRIQENLAGWQGSTPELLNLESEDLAIAKGAARFAHSRAKPSANIIHSPYPRDLFIEVEGLGEVCFIPKGHPRMTPFAVDIPGLRLRLGEDVRFQLHSVSVRGEKTTMPPLVLKLSGQKKKGTIPVRIESIVRETGVLEVNCLSEEGQFSLDFALEVNARPEYSLGLKLDFSEVKELAAAAAAIKETFHKDRGRSQKPEKLPTDLEKILGLTREEWSANHLRGLWPALESVMFQRALSPDHESIWFYLAGFCLRPGFGYQGDDERMLSLLRIYDESFRRVDGQAKLTIHWWILWRRLAGGLPAAFQQKIFDRYIPQLRKEKDPSPELIRLLGSLERLDPSSKIQLGRQLLNQLALSRVNQDTRVWALARIASRYPVYAPASAVLAPAQVEDWADEILALNLPAKARSSLYFAWAGRMRADRRYDIDPRYRELFLKQIDSPDLQKTLLEVTEVNSDVQAQMLADSLPSGFTFQE